MVGFSKAIRAKRPGFNDLSLFSWWLFYRILPWQLTVQSYFGNMFGTFFPINFIKSKMKKQLSGRGPRERNLFKPMEILRGGSFGLGIILLCSAQSCPESWSCSIFARSNDSSIRWQSMKQRQSCKNSTLSGKIFSFAYIPPCKLTWQWKITFSLIGEHLQMVVFSIVILAFGVVYLHMSKPCESTITGRWWFLLDGDKLCLENMKYTDWRLDFQAYTYLYIFTCIYLHPREIGGADT